MKFRRRRSRSSVEADDQSYQVDTVVSLFAVLLILLLTISAAVNINNEKTHSSYAPTDPETKIYPLRSACIIYPTKQYWFIRDGVLYKLDMAKIADLWLADRNSGTVPFTVTFESAHTILLIRKLQDNWPPTAYQLHIEWQSESGIISPPYDIVDQGLSIDHVLNTIENENASITAWFRPPLLFFDWPEKNEQAYSLLDKLQENGVTLEAMFSSKNGRVWVNREPNQYTRDTIFRC